jgi:hypothetical protein
MVRYIAGNSPRDTATARERILFPMVQRIQVNGLKDDTTAWDSAYGRMVEYTRENGGMGRRMDTGWKNVSTVRYDMKACGITIFQSENDDDAVNAHLHPSHPHDRFFDHISLVRNHFMISRSVLR